MTKAEDNKKYYLKNKEKINAYRKEYYLKNKEKEKIIQNKYYKKNLNHINHYLKKYHVERRKKDPNFNLKHRLRSRLNIVLKKFGNGKIFPSSKYGINYKKIINHLKPFPKEISKYHVDHIIPLCTFDLTDPKQILKAFAPENHQWLLAEQNLSKGGKSNWQKLF